MNEKNVFDKLSLSILLENADRISIPPNDGIEVFYKENKFEITSLVWSYLGSKSIIGVQPHLSSEKEKPYKVGFEMPGEPSSRTEITGLIKLDSKKVKLKSSLPSMISMKDLKWVSNLDPIKELIHIAAMEIALELDRKILLKMRQGAGIKTSWDYMNSLGDTIIEKYEALYVKLHEVSKEIGNKIHVDGANFIITSPEIASIFETATAGFEVSSPFHCNLGISCAGTINKRWRIYKDPLFVPSKLIIGYSGSDPMRQGLIFSPKSLFEISGRQRLSNWDSGASWPLCSDYDPNRRS